MQAPRKPLFLALFLSLLLAACGAEAPTPVFQPQTADWCYTYDFTSSNYGATISSGEWTNGVGFQSDSGSLTVFLPHNQNVAPSLITADIESYAIGYEGGVDVTANFTIFGIAQNFSSTLPSGIYAQELSLEPQGANSYGNFISLDVDTESTIVIESISVYGMGSNPFPTNDCASEPTATNTPLGFPTLTATNTPTATSTPTNTPTPSPTSDLLGYDYCIVYNFAEGNEGFVAGGANPIGQWSSNGYWQDTTRILTNPLNYTEGGIVANITFSGALSIRKVVMSVDFEKGTFDTGNPDIGYLLGAAYINIGNTVNLNNPLDDYIFEWNHASGAPTGFQLTSQNRLSSPANGSAQPGLSRYNWVILYGINVGGGIPPEASPSCTPSMPTSTPTFTPSPTYTPSPTATAYPQCGFTNSSFSNGLSGWSNSGAEAVPGAAQLEDGDSISQDMNLPGGDYQLRIVASAWHDSSGSGTVEIEFSENLDSETDSLTYSLSDFQNATNQLTFEYDLSLSTAGARTFTFTPTLTGSLLFTRIESICLYPIGEGVDNGGGDGSSDSDGGGIDWLCEVLAFISPLASGACTVSEIGSGGNSGGSNSGFSYQCGETITSPPLSVFEIGNWIIFLGRILLQWFQCTLLPFIIAIIQGIQSLIDNILLFFVWLGTLWWWLALHIQNFFAWLEFLYFRFLVWGVGTSLDASNATALIIAMATKAIAIMLNYLQIAQAYIAVAGFLVIRIVTAYNGAVPTPPPGLPDCLTAPQSSDLCAVYYVAENTLFSGLLGALIIPILTIYIDIIIILYALNLVRKFIGTIQEVLNG